MTRTLPILESNAYTNEEKTFVPTQIPFRHHQLRHLISSPQRDIVYYVHDRDVFRLNTQTRKRTHIVELPFGARCVATGYGWFCAGGDNLGQFSALKIVEGSGSEDSQESYGNERLDRLLSQFRRHHPQAHFRRLGGDLVNSVTLTKMEWKKENGEQGQDVVAVLTNNDKSIKMYALNARRVIWQGENEEPPNHASVSPDGTLMLVVGDKEVGYVYQREPVYPPASDDKLAFPDWTLLREVPLHRPSQGEEGKAAYFITAWSDTGRLCATASEFGYVQVFDVENLRKPDEDPLVAIVSSSRAMKYPGAVRTMAFAPAPWDLLIWAESNERVCIADLRSGLMPRQTICLNQYAEDVVTCDPIDSPEPLRDNLLGNPDSDPDDLRRLTHNLADPDYPNVEPLTRDEQDILRLIRTAREQESQPASPNREETEPVSSAPRSVITPSGIRPRSTTSGNVAAVHVPRTTEDTHDPQPSDRTHRRSLGLLDRDVVGLGGLPAPPAISNPWQADSRTEEESHAERWLELSRLQEEMASGRDAREDEEDEMPDLTPTSTSSNRNRANARHAGTTGDQPNLNPSNRHFMSLLEGERAGARRRNATGESGRQSQEPGDESLTSLGHSVRAREQRAHDESTEDQPTGNSAATGSAEGPPRHRAALLANMRRRQLDTVVGTIGEPRGESREQTREPARYIRPGPDSTTYVYGVQNRVRGMETVGREEAGVGISGLALSGDGGVLYVGTEEGIFEIGMNFQSRKYWPAVEMR